MNSVAKLIVAKSRIWLCRPESLLAFVVVSHMAHACQATPVFLADFESSTSANIGTINHSGGPAPQLVPVDGSATHTDWGTNSVWWDRSASSGSGAGFTAELTPESRVELDGATLTFDFVLRRTNTPDAKSHFVTAFDSNGNTVFSVQLVDREDSGLTNIELFTTPPETDERQRQIPIYVDPATGATMFAPSQIASGTAPDGNDRSGGSNSFTFFFGNDNRDAANVNEAEAGSFAVTTTATGWTLSAEAYQADTSLPDFTTNELPFSDNSVVDIARIEITGETVQAGGYWDNLSLDGTIIPEPSTLMLLGICFAICGTRRKRD